jgi:hypothetical protein
MPFVAGLNSPPHGVLPAQGVVALFPAKEYSPLRCAGGRACKDPAQSVLRAGILSLRKITVKGPLWSPRRWAQAQTL